MKKLAFLLILFLAAPLFVSAGKGCCLNPYQDVCVESDSSLCCPRDSIVFTAEGPAIDYNYCINNYFINDSNCLDLESDLCIKGCCCNVEGTDTKVYSARVEYKAGCIGEGKYWLGLDDCSEKGCRDYFDSITITGADIMGNEKIDSTAKSSFTSGGLCTEGQTDPSNEFTCRLWNLEPNKKIWRWCNYRSCATAEGCLTKYNMMSFQGRTFACKANMWKEIFSPEELATDSMPDIVKLDCAKTNPKDFYPSGCVGEEMKCRKGIFRVIKSWFGNWCNSDETVINEECEGLAKCCQKKALVEKLDWSNKNGEDWSSPVKSQGESGACWAFASVASAESQLNIKNNNPRQDTDLSEQMLVSCSVAGDVSGGYPEYASNYIVKSGIVDEDCFPFQQRNVLCSKICAGWKSRRSFFNKLTTIGGTDVLWKNINGVYTRTTNMKCIKPLIRNEGPIPLCFWGPGTYDLDYTLSCEDSAHYAGHCVLAVGFDDKKREWIVKNSWGASWGNDGFFTIKYNSCEEFLGPSLTQAYEPDFSAVYCSDLGYNFTIMNSDKGEIGVCNLPGGTTVDAWRFFFGQVSQDFSFCSRKGYEMITKTDGKNSISRDYAACIINGQEIAVSDLMGYTNSSEIAQAQHPELIKNDKSVIYACAAFGVIIIIFTIMLLRLKK